MAELQSQLVLNKAVVAQRTWAKDSFNIYLLWQAGLEKDNDRDSPELVIISVMDKY